MRILELATIVVLGIAGCTMNLPEEIHSLCYSRADSREVAAVVRAVAEAVGLEVSSTMTSEAGGEYEFVLLLTDSANRTISIHNSYGSSRLTMAIVHGDRGDRVSTFIAQLEGEIDELVGGRRPERCD